VFTAEARERLRAGLASAAQADARISAAALVGSSALGSEDEWSDIDLALCIYAESERAAVIAEWTNWMYRKAARAMVGGVHSRPRPRAKTQQGG
jgi:predicted nucleotidyltransferase